MAFKSVDEVLSFAIGKEEEAAKMYADLAGQMKKPYMRKVFEDFANEELGHKEKLLGIKREELLQPVAEKVMDLKIAEMLVDVVPVSDMDYQQALILAMKEEKAAFKLYTELAGSTDDESLRATLLSLAQEEARHKLRFEIEYDDEFLSDY